MSHNNSLSIQHVSQLQSFIDLLPGHIYWKNRQGQYQGSNNANLRIVFRCPEKTNYIGKTLYDFPNLPRTVANQINENDEQIMSTKTATLLEETAPNDQGHLITYISRKIPIINNDIVTGLLGVSYPKSKQAFVKELHQSTLPQPGYLSKQEHKCLKQLLKGETAEEIGDSLHLSRRTVETYLRNAKHKLHCQSRTELIITAVKMGLV